VFELYKYQNKFVHKVRYALSRGAKHLLCQSPTGSGKTVIFADITRMAVGKGSRVMIVTDRTELLNQASETVRAFGSTPYYFRAGVKLIDRDRKVFIAMAQTLRNRIKQDDWFDFIANDIDMIIIDEAHVQEFNYLFESKVLDDKVVLGFTATPYRTGKMRQLGLDYEQIILGPSIRKLISRGKLVNCDIYDCGSPDMSKVAINRMKGDYNEKQMFDVFNTTKLYKGLIKNYRRYTPNQKMLVFCTNIQHAIKTTKRLNKEGFTAKFVCSRVGKPKAVQGDDVAEQINYERKLKRYNYYKKNFDRHSGERKCVFDGFKNNEFKILVNVDIATKGYDCPDIEVICLYRATLSLTLYLQILGRGGRIAKGKSHFTVFDFGDNKSRFGGYEEHRLWSLWHTAGQGDGIPPLKECGIDNNSRAVKPGGRIKSGCHRLILASAKVCPFCGFEYPEKDEAAEIDLMLASIKDKKGVSLKTKSFDKMTHEELHKYREIKKHQMPWLWRQLWLRGEEKEIIEFAKRYGWGKNSIDRAIRYSKAVYN